MADTIYLEPILRNFFSNKMSEMNYCLPARIENVQNLKEGRVDVKPLYIPRYIDNTYSELPVIKNVPIVFPSSNKSGTVFPVEQGDTVLLIFAQCNIDNFKGGSVEPYSTAFDRKFDINDAIALVGFSPFNINPINTEKHERDYELGDVSLFNNLGKDNENKINVKKDGANTYVASSHNFDGEVTTKNKVTMTNDVQLTGTQTVDGDIIINGISLKQFIASHNHNYTDDGSPMITAPPNPL
jgi:hypothetical protein